jgi:uncharacterized protein YbbK (DUF523 family)
MRDILIGVSACLLGEHVRYDGGHKRNTFLLEELAPHVRLIPVCPEVGIGLGVPREAIRLVRRGDRVRLLGSAGADYTDAMRRWAGTVIGELRERKLSGFVLKKGSPSCGVERVRVWDEGAGPWRIAWLRPYSRGNFLQALCDDESRGGLDQCEVREGLREVPELSAGLGVELLRVQPERGCGLHEAFHQMSCPLRLADDRQRRYEPEGADEEAALLAG